MRVGVLRSRSGESTVINWSVGNSPKTLVKRGLIDCVIVETEDGFSQLGMMRRFLSHEIGLDPESVTKKSKYVDFPIGINDLAPM